MFSLNRDYSIKKYSILTIILIISYCIIFYPKYFIKKDTKLYNFLYCKCLYNNKNYDLSKLRNDTYFTNCKEHSSKNCMISIWEIYHLFFHFCIGYYFDIYHSLIGGILFELYEYKYWQCESLLDILWNTIGAFSGRYIALL